MLSKYFLQQQQQLYLLANTLKFITQARRGKALSLYVALLAYVCVKSNVLYFDPGMGWLNLERKRLIVYAYVK